VFKTGEGWHDIEMLDVMKKLHILLEYHRVACIVC